MEKSLSPYNDVFDISLDKLQNLMYGLIAGFVKRKIQRLKNSLGIYPALGLLTKVSLEITFVTCVPEANKKFAEILEASKGEVDYMTFVDVLYILPKFLDYHIETYISTCENGDQAKAIELTKDYREMLTGRISQQRINYILDSKNYDKIKKKVEKLNLLKEYFDYEPTNFLVKILSKTRTVCDFIKKEDTWKGRIKKWFDYASSIASCGAKKFVENFLENEEKFVSLLKKGLFEGIKILFGKNFFTLAKIFWNFIRSLRAENSNYYAAGETLGSHIADISTWNGIKRRK